jgi:type II secretory pathway pseudopilin PulG
MVLLEVLVVLAVIAILVGIAYPFYMRQYAQAQDMAAKLMLTTALRGEAAAQPELGRYTEDPAYLKAIFPEYDFSGAFDESIHVVVADVEPDDGARVLMYTRSRSGMWFGTALVLHGDGAGRHTCLSPWEDTMTPAACTGVAW